MIHNLSMTLLKQQQKNGNLCQLNRKKYTIKCNKNKLNYIKRICKIFIINILNKRKKIIKRNNKKKRRKK